MTDPDASSAKRIPRSTVREKIDDAWDYHETLEGRKREAAEEDEIGAAYFAGQQSGLLHMVDVLEGLLEEDDG